MRRPRGITLLEISIAIIALLAVIGPLFYAYVTGSQMVSAGRSQAMLSALVAVERLRHDLDRIAFPDNPDADEGGTRPRALVIKEPGPLDGSRIAFWVPRPRPSGGSSPRRIALLPVGYYPQRIGASDTFYLIREEGGQKRPLPGVVLSRILFSRVFSDATPVDPGVAFSGSLPQDMLRVTLVGVARAASREAIERDDARQVHSFQASFLASVREPTLFTILRSPSRAQDRYQFLEPMGALP